MKIDINLDAIFQEGKYLKEIFNDIKKKLEEEIPKAIDGEIKRQVKETKTTQITTQIPEEYPYTLGQALDMCIQGKVMRANNLNNACISWMERSRSFYMETDNSRHGMGSFSKLDLNMVIDSKFKLEE